MAERKDLALMQFCFINTEAELPTEDCDDLLCITEYGILMELTYNAKLKKFNCHDESCLPYAMKVLAWAHKTKKFREFCGLLRHKGIFKSN